MVTGDFNIDVLKINDKHIKGEYFDKLTSHSFYPTITVPTRLTNNNGRLIDNLICKLTECTLYNNRLHAISYMMLFKMLKKITCLVK